MVPLHSQSFYVFFGSQGPLQAIPVTWTKTVPCISCFPLKQKLPKQDMLDMANSAEPGHCFICFCSVKHMWIQSFPEGKCLHTGKIRMRCDPHKLQ